MTTLTYYKTIDMIPITWKRYDMDMLWIQQELEYD